MTTLRDFISGRETEIKAQMKALRKELGDLKVAKSALELRTTPQGSDGQVQATRTIKDMIRDVLKSMPNGLTSTEILSKIDESFGRQIERTSLSPQLSRMKDDGEVTLIDNLWFLPAASEEGSQKDYGSLSEENNDWADNGGFGSPDFEDEIDSESPF